MFVPLLRMTVRAANMEPRAYTYVIGTRPADKGARPNPFRLDEPPLLHTQLCCCHTQLFCFLNLLVPFLFVVSERKASLLS